MISQRVCSGRDCSTRESEIYYPPGGITQAYENELRPEMTVPLDALTLGGVLTSTRQGLRHENL